MMKADINKFLNKLLIVKLKRKNVMNNSMELQVNYKLYFYSHQSIMLGPVG
jgi:hypothetical protein